MDLGIDLGKAGAVWNREGAGATPADGIMTVDELLSYMSQLVGAEQQPFYGIRPADQSSSGCLDIHLNWTESNDGVEVEDVQWIARLLNTVSTLQREGDKTVPRRSVRFFVGHGVAAKHEKSAAAIDVEVGEPYSALIEGVLGDLAGGLARGYGRGAAGVKVCYASARWVRLKASASQGRSGLGSIVAALAYWWAYASPIEVVTACQNLEDLFVQRISESVSNGCRRIGMGETECFSHTLELVLAGLWQIAPLLGPAEEAEEELEGWQREIEIGIRRRMPFGSAAFISRENGDPGRLSFDYIPNDIMWNQVYVPALTREVCVRGGAPHLVRSCNEKTKRSGGVKRGLPRVPADFFDGERTLAEIAMRLCVETPMSWEEAARLVAAWVRKGYVGRTDAPDYTLPDPEAVKGIKDIDSYFDVPELGEASRSRSVLYFAYGSCMCRTSFRDTVPRYELVGSARLSGHRLGFTHVSTRRGGGTADIVTDPAEAVWGILYRIPRRYVYRLDAREGVFVNRYERLWVDVEALGTRFERVLTYGVIEKAPSDIPPSDEYAGLIWDGAFGMIEEKYCRQLRERMGALGVEPISPL